jgi:hypothetical protein
MALTVRLVLLYATSSPGQGLALRSHVNDNRNAWLPAQGPELHCQAVSNSMNPSVRSYFAMLFAVARWRLLAVLALMVLFSLTEGIGLALLLPTLQIAGLNLVHQGDAGRYASLVSAAFFAIGLKPTLILLLGVYVMLVGVRTLLRQLQDVSGYAVQQNVEHHLRFRLYRAIAEASWLFICRSSASGFTHALTAEVESGSPRL